MKNIFYLPVLRVCSFLKQHWLCVLTHDVDCNQASHNELDLEEVVDVDATSLVGTFEDCIRRFFPTLITKDVIDNIVGEISTTSRREKSNLVSQSRRIAVSNRPRSLFRTVTKFIVKPSTKGRTK